MQSLTLSLPLDGHRDPKAEPSSGSEGRLIVLTGPSGVGKGTLVKQLRTHYPDLHFSVSVTTRSPRPGEQDGINYFFWTLEKFRQLQHSGGLLEWAEYAGNCYGTPLEAVMDKLKMGKDVLLEIELDGARQVKQRYPDTLRIFIRPPSLAELERRLRERGQDSEISIQRRLAQAEMELEAIDEFDYVVMNDDLGRALRDLEGFLYQPARLNPLPSDPLPAC